MVFIPYTLNLKFKGCIVQKLQYVVFHHLATVHLFLRFGDCVPTLALPRVYKFVA